MKSLKSTQSVRLLCLFVILLLVNKSYSRLLKKQSEVSSTTTSGDLDIKKDISSVPTIANASIDSQNNAKNKEPEKEDKNVVLVEEVKTEEEDDEEIEEENTNSKTCHIANCSLPDPSCTYCVRCKKNFETPFDLNAELSRSTCIAKVENCERYLKNGKCDRCKMRLSVVEIHDKQYCSDCDSLTIDNKQCSSCDNAKNLFLIDGRCQMLEFCTQLNDKNEECKACVAGHLLLKNEKGTNACYKEIENCLKGSQTENKCDKCDESKNFRLNVKSGSCILAIEHCNFYNDKTTENVCTICEDGYHPSDTGKCVYSGCLKFEDGFCAVCDKDYALNDSKLCEKIIPNCKQQHNGSCIKCNSGFQYSDFKCVPAHCVKFLESEQAILLSNHEAKYNTRLIRNYRKQSTILPTKDKVDETLYQYFNPCQECEPNFILDKKSGECWSQKKIDNYENISLNCKEIYDRVCVKCNNGFEKSPEGLCIISHCVVPAPEDYNCSVCKLGYTINKIKAENGFITECKACTDKDTIDECNICPLGKRLKVESPYRTDTICFPIIEGCLTYDESEEKCSQCESDYLRSNDSRYCFNIDSIDSKTCKLMMRNKLITYTNSDGECVLSSLS